MNQEKHNKGCKLPAEPLTRDEVVALMNACSKRAPSGNIFNRNIPQEMITKVPARCRHARDQKKG